MAGDNDPSGLLDCGRCHATVKRSLLQSHNHWHARVEGLEPPTSKWGFWDEDKRWNQNSQEW
ncbi:hypothetical protein [Isoptericola sp. NPDC055881]